MQQWIESCLKSYYKFDGSPQFFCGFKIQPYNLSEEYCRTEDPETKPCPSYPEDMFS